MKVSELMRSARLAAATALLVCLTVPSVWSASNSPLIKGDLPSTVTGLQYNGPYVAGTNKIAYTYNGKIPLIISGVVGQKLCGVGLQLLDGGQSPIVTFIVGPGHQSFPITAYVTDIFMNSTMEATRTFRAKGVHISEPGQKEVIYPCQGESPQLGLKFIHRDAIK